MDKKQDALFVITAEKVVELKEAIEAAKSSKTVKLLGKLSPLHSVSLEELQKLEQLADEEFLNGEWFDSCKTYGTLVENLKLGPSRNLGRFALSLMHTGPVDKAIALAQQAYKEVPEEPSSYEALALYTADTGRILESTRWVSLAVAAAGKKSPLIASLALDLSHQVESRTFGSHSSPKTAFFRNTSGFFSVKTYLNISLQP